jgi:hypothetical protein
MRTDLPHLNSFPQPTNLPLLLRPLLQDIDSLRIDLHHLDITAQTLKAEKVALERQLAIVRKKIIANDNQIRRTMKTLDKSLFDEQRSERQGTFMSSTTEDDNVIEGLWKQMQLSPLLQNAIDKVVKEEGGIQENSIIGQAIMTELTGNTFQFFHDVATRVSVFDPNKGVEEDLPIVPPTGLVPVDAIEPANGLMDIDADTRADREGSVIPLKDISTTVNLGSPSVKSEANSIATPSNVANTLPALTTAAMAGSPASPTSGGPTPSVVARGLNALQGQFPGLLDSINSPATQTTHTRAQPTPPAKRGRAESIDTDGSYTPSLRNGKKAKIERETGENRLPHMHITVLTSRSGYLPHVHHVHQAARADPSVWQINHSLHPLHSLPADQARCSCPQLPAHLLPSLHSSTP